MTSVSQPRNRRMYSWWWDSHISPKNSKWLQENLTDMDSKVKQMIKVIEEDADSFARRAEMYYKKRPELMKLVEEFYRAYRALAERYDHATGVIRQAHRTMAEAFPNQAHFMLSDESPDGGDPHTPDAAHLGRGMFEPDEFQKETFGLPPPSQFHSAKRNGGFADDPDSVIGRKGVLGTVKKFGERRARKGLNFHSAEEERDQSTLHNGSQNLQSQALTDSDRMGKAEMEISSLKSALAKLESEKEAGLLKYEQSLERLSNLESEVSRAQSDSAHLNERASKAEAEVRNLKEALAKLQVQREDSLLQYQQYLEQISNLETKASSAQKNAVELDERARNAESEAEAVKRGLNKVAAEKDDALEQYKKSLEMISNLQGKLVQAEEDARQINQRAEKAEREIESLKREFSKLNEEKEAAVARYMQCLETISNLESKLARAQEEAERLNSEIKGAEEKCHLLENSNIALQSELESLAHKFESQGEELTEKQKELGRLWACIQEERLRFVEAETAFQTLQHLHSQSQEELRSLVSELQNKAEVLNDIQTRNQGLEDEVRKVMEEKKSLNELNLSSAVSIKNLHDDISSLRETIKRLEAEVELRVDQRNALQQEIYCLREELKELSKKHQGMLEQVESVGYDPECFGSSVKDLQDENLKLKESCEKSQIEKVALLEQLKIMEQLMAKNAVLENSIADLNDELDGVREKVNALQASCQSLLEEKSNLVAERTSLISQLQATNENLEKLSERHNILENSLFDANAELEGLRVKSKSLEDSCLMLDGENSGLKAERDSLVSQLDLTQKRLKDLGDRYTALEETLSSLAKDRENALSVIHQLSDQLDDEKKQHAAFCQLSGTQLASRELQISQLKEEGLRRKKEFEDEQDKALNAQIEILILLKFIQGLEEKHSALLAEQQKLFEDSEKSKELISEIQHENIEQKVENKSLSDHNSALRSGLYQLMKVLDVNESKNCADKAELDQRLLSHLIVKLQEAQDLLVATFDENQRLVMEKSVLVAILEQLESDGTNLMTERDGIDQKHKLQSEKLSALQVVRQELCQSIEELKQKIVMADQREEVLKSKTEDLQRQLVNLKNAYEILKKDNVKAHEETKSLMINVSDLEEENHALFGKTVFHSNMSLVLNDVVAKNLVQLADLSDKMNKLDHSNNDLDERARGLEQMLEGLRMENMHLKDVLVGSDNDLRKAKSINDQLQNEIVNAKGLLIQKENDIEQSESQADALSTELQMSKVRETLLEAKIAEIVQACAGLADESSSKGVEIELLKEKLGTLEDSNKELQTQLTSYTSAVVALNSCIESLEKHTVHGELSKLENRESEDATKITQQVELSKSDGILELQDFRSRIEAVETAVKEKVKVAMLDNFVAGTKLDSAKREIEELKARGAWENGQMSNHDAQERDGLNKNLRVKTRRPKTQEISELDNEVLTKDIVLDQTSSDFPSFGHSKRSATEGDGSHLLEMWETADHNGSIDLTVSSKAQSQRSKNPSVESLIEKELGVDKLEVSRRYSRAPRQEGSKRKTLERLDSDAQKLSNLQITVQDLKRKVEITEKSKKGKSGSVEYGAAKAQLDEADEAVAKLFDANRKLVKSFEDGSQSTDGIAIPALDESGSVRRRRVSEQARRGSEKIGRLQLEVQRLQFLLLKLDGDEVSRARNRVPEQKTRVLLRDYLYGGGTVRTRKYKKPSAPASFCSCVQPPTSGD